MRIIVCLYDPSNDFRDQTAKDGFTIAKRLYTSQRYSRSLALDKENLVPN